MSRRTRLSERVVARIRGGVGAMLEDQVVTRRQLLSLRYWTVEIAKLAWSHVMNSLPHADALIANECITNSLSTTSARSSCIRQAAHLLKMNNVALYEEWRSSEGCLDIYLNKASALNDT